MMAFSNLDNSRIWCSGVSVSSLIWSTQLRRETRLDKYCRTLSPCGCLPLCSRTCRFLDGQVSQKYRLNSRKVEGNGCVLCSRRSRLSFDSRKCWTLCLTFQAYLSVFSLAKATLFRTVNTKIQKYLTNPYITLFIAVAEKHMGSSSWWPESSHIHWATQIWGGETRNNKTQLTTKVQMKSQIK